MRAKAMAVRDDNIISAHREEPANKDGGCNGVVIIFLYKISFIK